MILTTNCLRFLRTRIIRMTRILSLRLFCLSALSIFGRFVWFVFVSTLACGFTNTNLSNDTNFEPTALLLELNLYSVDSLDSCSFQHLLELLRTRIFRITRNLSLWLFCLSALSIFGRFVWFVFVSTRAAWGFTNTNISNYTNFEPTALLLERFIYIR